MSGVASLYRRIQNKATARGRGAVQFVRWTGRHSMRPYIQYLHPTRALIQVYLLLEKRETRVLKHFMLKSYHYFSSLFLCNTVLPWHSPRISFLKSFLFLETLNHVASSTQTSSARPNFYLKISQWFSVLSTFTIFLFANCAPIEEIQMPIGLCTKPSNNVSI